MRSATAIQMNSRRMYALLFNGCIAFGLNVVSFTANKKSGPLTMTVAGASLTASLCPAHLTKGFSAIANVKQVLTIFLAVLVFDVNITPINGLGIMLTLAGGMWYAGIEYKEKRTRIIYIPESERDRFSPV